MLRKITLTLLSMILIIGCSAITAAAENTDTSTDTAVTTETDETMSLSDCTIKLSQTSFAYSGKENQPIVTALYGDNKLIENTDYVVTYESNVNIGTGTVTVSGLGKYTDSKTVSFDITLGKMYGIKTYSSKTVARISWSAVKGATSYNIYMKNSDGKFVKVDTTTKNAWRKSKLSSGKSYYFKICPVVNGKEGTMSSSITVKTSANELYKVSDKTKFYSTSKKYSGVLQAGLYTGYENSISYNGYIVIKVGYTTSLVKKSECTLMDYKTEKILLTGCVSQLGGARYLAYACGPTSLTMLLNAEKNAGLTKSETASKLSAYGFWGCNNFMSNGISSYSMTLASKYQLGYTIKNESIKMTVSNIKKQLTNKIKAGKRVIVCVRHDYWADSKTNATVNSINTSGSTHYVVVTGYYLSGGKKYFVIADPWFSDQDLFDYKKTAANYKLIYNKLTSSYAPVTYNYGTYSVSADTLAKSMKSAVTPLLSTTFITLK